MDPDQHLAAVSLELTRDAAGIDASLLVVAAVPADDPSDPEIGYYTAELRTLRAAMMPRIRLEPL